MTGTLHVFCSRCFEALEWRKVEFTRGDSYPDWCLQVFCGCGLWIERDHPDLYREARDAYDAALCVELETMRRNLLDAALGKSGNLYFETLSDSLPSSTPEDGQG